MFPVKNISDKESIFPIVTKDMMPAYNDIPDEFKSFDSTNKWVRLFSDWFYNGLTKLEMIPKAGIDQEQALKHIKTVMGSWEPKHEHKSAAVAFLFNEWFEDAKWEKKEHVSR